MCRCCAKQIRRPRQQASCSQPPFYSPPSSAPRTLFVKRVWRRPVAVGVVHADRVHDGKLVGRVAEQPRPEKVQQPAKVGAVQRRPDELVEELHFVDGGHDLDHVCEAQRRALALEQGAVRREAPGVVGWGGVGVSWATTRITWQSSVSVGLAAVPPRNKSSSLATENNICSPRLVAKAGLGDEQTVLVQSLDHGAEHGCAVGYDVAIHKPNGCREVRRNVRAW